MNWIFKFHTESETVKLALWPTKSLPEITFNNQTSALDCNQYAVNNHKQDSQTVIYTAAMYYFKHGPIRRWPL